MLTASYLDGIPERIVALYQQYEESVILDIARRLGTADFSNTASWQMQRLVESGAIYENSLKEIGKLTGKSQEELRAIFQASGVKAMRFDDEIYRAAGLNPLPLNLSPAMGQVLAAGLQKTNGLMENLTLSTALGGQQAYLNAADLAYLQVSQGAMSYTQAITQAVKGVADKGLSVVQFPRRTEQLDVAIRRAVLTGVSQTTGKLQETRADEMGCDLVQTSAHSGARPAHVVWQGQVFSRSGTSRKYPPFVESTGYGTGAGLMGWNCRHSWFPFFEGISANAYNKVMLEDLENKKVTYQGEEISVYDATQEQRAIERKIRYWKRQEGALQAAGLGDEAGMASAKVRAWQGKMRSFVRETGLMRQGEREQVIGYKRTRYQIQNKKPEKITLQEFEDSIYNRKTERGGLFSSKTGKLLVQKDGSKNSIQFTDDEVKDFKGNIFTHNHPSGGPFSFEDLQTWAITELQEIRATGMEFTYVMKNYQGNKKISFFSFAQYFQQAAENIKKLGIDFGGYKEYNHNVLIEFAKLAGLDYERIPRIAKK